MVKNELLEVHLSCAKEDLEKAKSLLKKEGHSDLLLLECAYRLGVTAGLERAINSPAT